MTARRTTVTLLVAAVLLLVAHAPLAQATPAEDAQLVSKINASRSSAGLAAYANRADLHTLAQRQAQRQADVDGAPFHNANLAQEAGSGWKMLGENVGVGQDVSGLHTAFMNSPHHRDNIMSTQFTEVGVGTARGKSGRLFVAEVFRLPASQSASVASSPAPAPAPKPVAKPAVAPVSKPRVVAVPATVPPAAPPTTVAPTTTTVAPSTTVAPVAADETASGQLEAVSQAAAVPTVTVPAIPRRASLAAEVAAGMLILVVGLQALAVRRQLATA